MTAGMLPAGIVEHETAVGGARIRWLETGTGDPPFVLVHGWGWGAIRWLPLMPLLGRQRRTIAMDLPGFGGSSVPPGRYSPAWFAGSVRALLDGIGVERAILVGNSLGGLISIWFAAAWADRVEGLAALAPALPNDGPPPSARAAAAYVIPTIPLVGDVLYGMSARLPASRIVAESLERNCSDPSRVSAECVAALEEEAARRASRPDAWWAAVRANRQMIWALSGRREQTWRVVRSLRVPTLFLWGEGDRILPSAIGDRAVREVAGSQLVVLKGCGHNPQLECPEDVAGAVIAFARATAAR